MEDWKVGRMEGGRYQVSDNREERHKAQGARGQVLAVRYQGSGVNWRLKLCETLGELSGSLRYSCIGRLESWKDGRVERRGKAQGARGESGCRIYKD